MEETAVVRSFCTLREMMDDRQMDHDLHKITNDDLTKELEKKLSTVMDDPFIALQVNEDLSIVYVLPANSNAKSNTSPKIIIDYLKEKVGKASIILVTNEKMNTNSMKTLVKHNDKQIDIQVFSLKELLFNPYKHELVPQHRILTIEEGDHVVNTLKLKSRSQLPIIQKDDAIAKYLNIKSGDIVHIIRKCATSSGHNVYRYCI